MIISLDCSTTCIGWAVFEEDNLVEYGRIEPTEKGLDWRDRVHNLLPQIYFSISQIYMHTLGF